jgi:hypothetical protein
MISDPICSEKDICPRRGSDGGRISLVLCLYGRWNAESMHEKLNCQISYRYRGSEESSIGGHSTHNGSFFAKLSIVST